MVDILTAVLAVVDTGGEIYGDVANVAARVRALAEPGSVMITAQVQRQWIFCQAVAGVCLQYSDHASPQINVLPGERTARDPEVPISTPV